MKEHLMIHKLSQTHSSYGLYPLKKCSMNKYITQIYNLCEHVNVPLNEGKTTLMTIPING
jgi:hypothetical protein